MNFHHELPFVFCFLWQKCIPSRPYLVVSMTLFRFQKVALLPQILTMHLQTDMSTGRHWLCMPFHPLPSHTRFPIGLGWHTLVSQHPTVLTSSFPTGDRHFLRQPAFKRRGLDKLLSTFGSSFSISPEITEAPCTSEETGLSNFLQVFHKKRNGS